jgi:L-2-hydroxyglutarate oxidase LhgO
MITRNKDFNVIIVGGGFYGCMIALFLREYHKKVLLIEAEESIITKASYHNQARVHNGYHYPRNFLTGIRSHRNYARFIEEFKSAIDDSFFMIYGVARSNSKVTSNQFIRFCKQIGLPLHSIPGKYKKLFNENLIEELFMVDEVVFNAAKIRNILEKRLEKANVDIIYKTKGVSLEKKGEAFILNLSNGETIRSKHIINATYAKINSFLRESNLPLLPFKYEYAEMPIVQMPDSFKKIGVTIMDGPFFSLMPFPDKNLHSLHHVRYTPQLTWFSDKIDYRLLEKRKSQFLFMKKDASRYIADMKDLKYVTSLYEVKTVLQQNESNDGRPILFRRDYGHKNFSVVMGGKIDNIYDTFDEFRKEIQQPQFKAIVTV